MDFTITQDDLWLVAKVAGGVFSTVAVAGFAAIKRQWSKTSRVMDDKMTEIKDRHQETITNITDDHSREIAYLERRLSDTEGDLAKSEEARRRCEERWRKHDSFLV